MPDVTAGTDGPLPFIIQCRLDSLQDFLCGGNLVGTHHQQLLIHIEHAVFGEDVQQGMFGEESVGKIMNVRQQGVLLVGPVAGELEGVAIGLVLSRTALSFQFLGETSGVAVVFGLGAIADDEHLHKVEHRPACPERIPLVAVDLIKGLFDIDTTAF